jgi:hypothetical protein
MVNLRNDASTVIASVAKQSDFAIAASNTGLLRYARNDCPAAGLPG